MNNDSQYNPDFRPEEDPRVDDKALKNKKRLLLFGVIGGVVLLLLIGTLLFLMTNADKKVNEAEERAKQAEYLAEIARSEAEFAKIDQDYTMLEGQQAILANDSIIDKYAAAKAQIEKLLQELNNERTKSAEQISKLKAEIETLRTILHEYTNRINELMAENTELRDELNETKDKFNRSEAIVNQLSAENQAQKEKITIAEKLIVTGVELIPLNQKKNKREKNITKAHYLQVTFNVSPNNTTEPGIKKIYARITSPEGDLLGNGGTFTYEGRSVGYTDFVSIEYANEEIGGVSIYWPVTQTLNPGQYHLELFCDGNMIASKNFTLNKK